jgi:hypothetical protein
MTTFKKSVGSLFEDFYAVKVDEQLKKVEVDMRLSKIKPLYAQWVAKTLYDVNYSLNQLMPHCLDL